MHKDLYLPKDLCLPDDVIKIINQYAKPVTRPDWRQLHVMCDFKFLIGLLPYEKYRCKTTEHDDFYYFQIRDIDFSIINNSFNYTKGFH